MDQQRMIIVGVLHNLNLAYKFADKALLLHKGEPLSYGDTEEVFNKGNIKKAFGMRPCFLRDNKGERYLCF